MRGVVGEWWEFQERKAGGGRLQAAVDAPLMERSSLLMLCVITTFP